MAWPPCRSEPGRWSPPIASSEAGLAEPSGALSRRVAMILAWTLLVALSATDAGVEVLAVAPAEAPRPDCKPPGYWDVEARQCRPGCGIPVGWENGKQVGGCGGETELSPDLTKSVPKPKPNRKH